MAGVDRITAMVTKVRPNARIGPKKPHRVFLRERRNGMTQERLADLLGVSKATISRWEAWGAGERNPKLAREPSTGVLQAIAEALGVDTADLFQHPDTGRSLWSIIETLPADRQEEAKEILQVLHRAS